MSSENQEQFRAEYQAGQKALELGFYRESIQHLQIAIALIGGNSRLGGEAQLWLVTAYQSAGQIPEAIALCQQLKRHPDLETRQQSKHLLYILEAPQLNRPKEWLTEIPDLANLEAGEPKFAQNSAPTKKSSPRPTLPPEPIDLSQANTQDNRFIWFALVAIALVFGGLVSLR